jgi:hypothetical protein
MSLFQVRARVEFFIDSPIATGWFRTNGRPDPYRLDDAIARAKRAANAVDKDKSPTLRLACVKGVRVVATPGASSSFVAHAWTVAGLGDVDVFAPCGSLRISEPVTKPARKKRREAKPPARAKRSKQTELKSGVGAIDIARQNAGAL